MEASDVLKQTRGARGLTQEVLADLLPVTVDAVRQWEAGKTRPRRGNALILDEALQAKGAVAAAFGYVVVNPPAEVEQLRERVAELAQTVQDHALQLEALAAAVKRLSAKPRRSAVESR